MYLWSSLKEKKYKKIIFEMSTQRKQVVFSFFFHFPIIACDVNAQLLLTLDHVIVWALFSISCSELAPLSDLTISVQPSVLITHTFPDLQSNSFQWSDHWSDLCRKTHFLLNLLMFLICKVINNQRQITFLSK